MNDRDRAEFSTELEGMWEDEPHWKEDDFVFLPGAACGRLVRVKDIWTLDVEQNYTRVTTKDGNDQILVRRPLIWCETRLDPKIFFRANRECLLNLSYVKTVSPYDAKRLFFILMNGREIVLSRLRTIALRRKFAL